jgi:hypothetical protein
MNDREELQDVTERMVRSVFLDSPEGVDSVTVATNVTRALWEEGYRKQDNDGSSRDIIAGIIGQMAYGPGEGADLTKPQATADAILAAGYRKPRTITTRAEVEALGEGSVVRDSAGDAAEKRDGVWSSYETAPMTDSRLSKYLPATVLYEPEPQP